ncbi:hypothetical protein VIN01S_22370 [Vibrio inusitatus NBRC 102082]|uniref:Type I restriction modification DNA specificity domain-containing protein n=1 Tax=Vibrio inusitatus NBRC 102082 TaxID=1219070 RepID=A0A4Y3HW76_9VIBR|nr:restriction endonuclease subunit S [Vibrio inusitatus]GEA51433.1 hypothetical protein VIN01S_22370 [Vibrio inusitatus NBRC 102082]
MSELPKGWGIVSIFELCTPKQWKTIPTKSLLDEGYVVYGANGVIGKYNEFTHEHPTLMITCRGATCGNIHLSQPFSYINGNAMALDNLSPFVKVMYLKYYLLGFNFESIISGSAQPQITQKGMQGLTVSLPSLAEQKRIVEKLDEVLAQVDTIKARLDGIPNLLKRFRQSVLASAVSGKLTEEWCSTNRSFEWQDLTIGDISTVATGKTPKRTNSEYWNSEDVPWLTSSATGNLYCFEAEQFVSHFGAEDCKLKRFPVGTLLLAMYGEGKTRGQVTELMFEATCNQACAAIVVDEDKAHKSYVKLRLLENYEETRKAAAGGNQPNLNLNKVRKIGIKLPTMEEQKEIVRLVDQYFAFADTVEAQVKKAQTKVDNLTQSILVKAFRGELVEQDPNDDPADKLLERIAEARKEAEVLAKAVKKAESARKRAVKKTAENP